MRAYGQKYCHHNLPDNHPKKGYVNWWEVEWNKVIKKAERWRGKKQIEEGIIEHENSTWEPINEDE